MFFSKERHSLRKTYLHAWQKMQQGQPLQAMEEIIANVIAEHPEYHKQLQQLEKEYLPENGESNPFLHMGLHIALREQLSTNRPAGIATLTRQLLAKLKDGHEVEHQMLECLAESLWHAQRYQQAADEQKYLACVRQLVIKICQEEPQA
ncbi:MAG: DUF1841 family protein [Gammaproteobacteria bacterium]|nr:DUF1841 family protein [Gammaproteobacteria bacterium]